MTITNLKEIKMDAMKVKLSRELERSISNFERTTYKRKMELAFKKNASIQDFAVLATLGTGTFGRVKLVKLREFPDLPPMALKVLKKKAMVKLKQVEHVKSEKRVVEQISHPFTVQLKNSFQDEHYIYMLFDYVCGGEVFTRLRKEGRFSNDVALFYLTEIFLAFEYLHERGIAYRDLKPENLLIDKEGHVKITDFGFAKIIRDKSYTLCGTPEYLAPEIIKSRGHDKTADWWAFGILMFEMLAGYPPFYDDNPMGIYKKIVEGHYELPVIINATARDLIQRFLKADVRVRCGCGSSGPTEIRNHAWFRGVDWKAVFARQIPSPWTPAVKNEIDTHYFDQYPEVKETSLSLNEDEQDLFTDF